MGVYVDTSTGPGLGGLSNFTMIGGEDVSDDVISITTNQVSEFAEGTQPSKCTITLHDLDLKYAGKIASGEWVPRKVVVTSEAWLVRNYVAPGVGLQRGIAQGFIASSPIKQVIFVGVMTRINWDHLTCVIECECAASLLNDAMTEDWTWDPEKPLIDRVTEIVNKATEKNPMLHVAVNDLRTRPINIKTVNYATADRSTSHNVKMLADDYEASVMINTDTVYTAEGTTIFEIDIYDTGWFKAGEFDLTKYPDAYVLDPGNGSSIMGYANRVRVTVGNSEGATTTDHNVPNNQALVTSIIVPDDLSPEEIAQYGLGPIAGDRLNYGVIDGPHIRASNQFTREEAIKRAAQALLDFRKYLNKEIKVKIANIIPPLMSYITWEVPIVNLGYIDEYGHTQWRQITNQRVRGQVKKKSVSYSAQGLIISMEIWKVSIGSVDLPNDMNGNNQPEAPSSSITVIKNGHFNTWKIFKDGKIRGIVWDPTTQRTIKLDFRNLAELRADTDRYYDLLGTMIQTVATQNGWTVGSDPWG